MTTVHKPRTLGPTETSPFVYLDWSPDTWAEKQESHARVEYEHMVWRGWRRLVGHEAFYFSSGAKGRVSE